MIDPSDIRSVEWTRYVRESELGDGEFAPSEDRGNHGLIVKSPDAHITKGKGEEGRSVCRLWLSEGWGGRVFTPPLPDNPKLWKVEKVWGVTWANPVGLLRSILSSNPDHIKLESFTT